MEAKSIVNKLNDLALTFETDRMRAEAFISQLGYKIDLRLAFEKQFRQTINNLYPILRYVDCFINVVCCEISLEKIENFLKNEELMFILEHPELLFVNELYSNVLSFNDKKNEIKFYCDSVYLRHYIDYKKFVLKHDIHLISCSNKNFCIKDEIAYQSIKNDFMYSTEYDIELLSKITDDDVRTFQNSCCSYYDICGKYIGMKEYDNLNHFLIRQKLSCDNDKCKIIEKKQK